LRFFSLSFLFGISFFFILLFRILFYFLFCLFICFDFLFCSFLFFFFLRCNQVAFILCFHFFSTLTITFRHLRALHIYHLLAQVSNIGNPVADLVNIFRRTWNCSHLQTALFFHHSV